MTEPITYVGLDVHKDTIAVAVADGGLRGEVRYFGEIANSAAALNKLAGRLSRRGWGLHFCYEAGPCGYGVFRHLTGLGHACEVVAPSLIPRRPGERVKTDRRDAVALAKLHRAGALTAVWVPDAGHEAMRDLVRARVAALRARRRARQQLSSFLLRHGRVRAGKSWSVAHRRWLSRLRFEHPAQQIVLQDYIHAVEDSEARLQGLEAEIAALVPEWSLAPLVGALQGMRGIALITAVTLVAEVGDLRRFQRPSQLMAYLGLVPSEHSSGESRRRGGLTKTGNSEARRVMIEAAWTYRLRPRVTAPLLRRQEGLSREIREISWNAQRRLCARHRRMAARGKPKNLTTAAIAREMLGFAWDIARQVELKPSV
jgi:transposase